MGVWGSGADRGRKQARRAAQPSLPTRRTAPSRARASTPRTPPARTASARTASAQRPQIPKYYRWPDVGQVVQLYLGGENLPIPTKIIAHDTSADCLLVGAVGGSGRNGVIIEAGDRMVLTWILPTGIARLDTAFLSRSDDPSSSPTTWRLEPVSDVRVVERRRFRRLRSRQNLALRLPTREALPGVLVDVSEAGMRCLVDTINPTAVTRERLESVITLRGRQVGVGGLVVWTKHHGGHLEVGVRFDRVKRPEVEAIRAHVSAALAARS